MLLAWLRRRCAEPCLLSCTLSSAIAATVDGPVGACKRGRSGRCFWLGLQDEIWLIEFAAGVAEHSIEHPGCSVAVVYAKTLWCCCNMQHTQTHPIAFDPSWLSWLPGALNLHDLGHVNIPAGGEIEYLATPTCGSTCAQGFTANRLYD